MRYFGDESEDVLSKTLYIHIGTDKTGSTAIQSFFHSNSKVFEEMGLRFLSSGRQATHYDSLVNHHNKLTRQAKLGDYSEWRKAGDELVTSGMSAGLISAEGLFLLSVKQWEEIKNVLPAVNIVAVMYIRRQSDKLRSGIAQRIQGGTATVPVNLYTPDKLGAMAQDYHKRLRRLVAIFGKNNIVVRKYESSHWKNGSLLLDFCDAVGLDTKALEGGNRLNYSERDNTNPTLTVEALHFLDSLNWIGIERKSRETVKQHLIKTIRRIGQHLYLMRLPRRLTGDVSLQIERWLVNGSTANVCSPSPPPLSSGSRTRLGLIATFGV